MYVPLGLGLGQKEAEQKIWEWTSEPWSKQITVSTHMLPQMPSITQ